MPQRVTDVGEHQRRGAVAVAVRHRLRDGSVLARIGPGPVALGRASGQKAPTDLDDPQRLEDRHELGVARGASEREMEPATRVVRGGARLGLFLAGDRVVQRD